MALKVNNDIFFPKFCSSLIKYSSRVSIKAAFLPRLWQVELAALGGGQEVGVEVREAFGVMRAPELAPQPWPILLDSLFSLKVGRIFNNKS